MALNIKNPETERLARELSRVTGETLTKAVDEAVRERLSRIGSPENRKPLAVNEDSRCLADRLDEIALRVANLPDRDNRSADEILGYNERGHFD